MCNKQQGNNNSLCNPSKGAGISKYYTVVNPGQKKEKEKPGGGEARKPGRSQTQQGGHKRRPRAKQERGKRDPDGTTPPATVGDMGMGSVTHCSVRAGRTHSTPHPQARHELGDSLQRPP